MALTSHIALVEREADVYVASEHAAGLADEAGFDRYACGDIETAVSEICSNAIRHADGGWVAIRRLADRFEVSVTDTGPGFDGPRKAPPGLGIGLDGARRLMGSLRVERVPGGSKVTASRPLPGPTPDPVRPWSVEAVFRARIGEAVCGDFLRTETTADRLRVALADGLGSGPQARLSARRVLEESGNHEPPSNALLTAHRACRDTRGAAAAVVDLDDSGRGVHAGLGDVSTRVVGGEMIPARPGMVGHGSPEPIDTVFDVPPGGALLLWTDGLRRPDSRSDLRRMDLLGLEEVVRDQGSRRHDGTLVFIRRRS